MADQSGESYIHLGTKIKCINTKEKRFRHRYQQLTPRRTGSYNLDV